MTPSADSSRGLAFALVLGSNLLCGLAGLAQSSVVARVLGPAGFGVLGLCASVLAVVSNLTDVRFSDLCLRLFCDPAARGVAGGRDGRVDVLAATVVAQAGVATVASAVAIPAAVAYLAAIGSSEPFPWALVAPYLAALGSIQLTSNALGFTHRLAGSAAAMAVLQILAVGARTACIVAWTLADPTLRGVVLGTLAGSLASLAVNGAGAAHLWRRRLALQIAGADLGRGLRLLWGERALALRFNLVGYHNLAHRAADVLFVGWLAGERAAGFYRLARTCVDALQLVYDATVKNIQPRLFALLASGQVDAFRREARALVAGGLTVGVLVFAAEALALRPVVIRVFGEAFAPAVGPIAILTLPFVLALAFGTWTWPLVVQRHAVGLWLTLALPSVALLQYGLPLAIGALTGELSVNVLALGHSLQDVGIYVPLLLLLPRRLRAEPPEDAARAS